MKVSYDRLWKLLIDKKINKTQLKELAGINSNCIAKMGKDEPVHMEILMKICDAFEITLSQFFLEDSNQSVVLNERQLQLLEVSAKLDKEQTEALIKFLNKI